jgi:hypothetical protein
MGPESSFPRNRESSVLKILWTPGCPLSSTGYGTGVTDFLGLGELYPESSCSKHAVVEHLPNPFLKERIP